MLNDIQTCIWFVEAMKMRPMKELGSLLVRLWVERHRKKIWIPLIDSPGPPKILSIKGGAPDRIFSFGYGENVTFFHPMALNSQRMMRHSVFSWSALFWLKNKRIVANRARGLSLLTSSSMSHVGVSTHSPLCDNFSWGHWRSVCDKLSGQG